MGTRDDTGTDTTGAAAVAPPSHPGSAVLHERVMEGLPSGRFTLRAFVRDRTSLAMGGAHAVLDLPRSGQEGLSGPVLLQSARRYLLAPLPLFTKIGSSESRITEARTGEIPSPSSVRAAEPLEAVTWICPRQAPPSLDSAASVAAAEALAGALSSELTREGGAPTPLPAPRITRTGDCYRVSEALSAGTLAPGAYTYTIRWKSRPSTRPRTAEARFTVEPSATTRGAIPAR